MKKWLISFSLILALGSLLMLTSCANETEQKLPSNRTRETYELEKEFDPLITFFYETDKSFNGVEKYSATFSVYDSDQDFIEEISVDMGLEGDISSGTLTVTNSEGESTYPVRWSNGSLLYTADQPDRDLSKLLFLTIARKDIEALDIYRYSAYHTEMDLKTINYDVKDDSTIFEDIITECAINNIESESFILMKDSDGFDSSIIIETSDDTYIFASVIDFSE